MVGLDHSCVMGSVLLSWRYILRNWLSVFFLELLLYIPSYFIFDPVCCRVEHAWSKINSSWENNLPSRSWNFWLCHISLWEYEKDAPLNNWHPATHRWADSVSSTVIYSPISSCILICLLFFNEVMSQENLFWDSGPCVDFCCCSNGLTTLLVLNASRQIITFSLSPSCSRRWKYFSKLNELPILSLLSKWK